MISNGILNRAISEAAGKAGNAARYLNGLSGVDDNGGGQANAQALSFLYPYGATLNVARPAVPVLSTGSVSFPLNRPVCAFYSHPGSGGKLAVLGSGAMFADQYIGKKSLNTFVMKYYYDNPENIKPFYEIELKMFFKTRKITTKSRMSYLSS